MEPQWIAAMTFGGMFAGAWCAMHFGPKPPEPEPPPPVPVDEQRAEAASKLRIDLINARAEARIAAGAVEASFAPQMPFLWSHQGGRQAIERLIDTTRKAAAIEGELKQYKDVRTK